MTRAASGVVDFPESDCCKTSSAIDHHVSLFFGKQGVVGGQKIRVGHLDRCWGKDEENVLVGVLWGEGDGKEKDPEYPGLTEKYNINVIRY